MNNEQQKQTKNFFDKTSEEWLKKAKVSSESFVNVIKQRNQYVEYVALKYLKKNAKTLDIGCGTGDLVINLLKKGFDAYGIDFADSMIKSAILEAKKVNLPTDRFIVKSFFEFDTHDKYNLISANGFIEYISEEQLYRFIEKSYQMLQKEGILVVGSRNRLFNVFSFNEYTKAEIDDGNIIHLLEECIIFNKIKNLKELLIQNFDQQLSRNLKKHPPTGIRVDIRYQYTPHQIIKILRLQGFDIKELAPVHIHIFTTGANSIEPEIHDYISNKIQDNKRIALQLIPQASTFMIIAKK